MPPYTILKKKVGGVRPLKQGFAAPKECGMQRLTGCFIFFLGCSSLDVLKDKEEALRPLQRTQEGLQADGSYVACYHLSQMAQGQDMSALVAVAQMAASDGFFEVMGTPGVPTIQSGYISAHSKEWACVCFKGWDYVSPQ